ncbi:MAG: hypothetical protein O7F71_11305 [Gammaproteobacteria bacterium]|nr:hypothetical protein [Gammaproteobacteria bacterium]
MSRIRIFVWMAIVPIFMLIIALITLLASPGIQRWSIERYVSAITDKSFTIGSDYQLSLGRSVTMSAAGIRLQDGQEILFAAEQLLIEVDLQSVVAGPVVVERLHLVAAEFEFAADPETGTSYWEGEDEGESEFDLAELSSQVVFKDINIKQLAVRYGEGWLEEPRAVVLEAVVFRENENGYADVEFNGDWEGYPVAGRGRLAFPVGIFERSAFEKGFKITIGPYLITASAEVSEVLRGTAEIDYSIEGPEVGEFLNRIGFPVTRSGAVDLEGRLLIGVEGIHIDVKGTFGQLNITAMASAADLEEWSDLAFELDASGDDLNALGRVMDIDVLPAAPFELTARVETIDGTYHARQIALRTAGTEFVVVGTWNPALPLPEADLAFELDVSGGDLNALGRVIDIDVLPAAPFELTARVEAKDGTYHAHQIALRTAGAEFALAGSWNAAFPLPEADLSVEFQATDLSALLLEASSVEQLQVPANLTGHFLFDGTSAAVSEIGGTIGEYEVSASGIFQPFPEMIVGIQVRGDGATLLGQLVPNHQLNETELKAEADLRITPAGFTVEAATASIGDIRLDLSDRLDIVPKAINMQASIALSGPDLRQLGYDFAPAGTAYRLAGAVMQTDAGWSVHNLAAMVGGDTITLDGVLTDDGIITGELHARGDDLRVWYGLSDTLAKPAPYEWWVELDYVDGATRVDKLRLNLDAAQLRIDGDINEILASGVVVEIRGDSLEDVTDLLDLTLLEDVPFKLQGRLTLHDASYSVTDLDGWFGASDIAGSLSVTTDLAGPDPFSISVELYSERLDFEELFDLEEFDDEPATGPADRLIPEFDLARLDLVPIDFVWKAEFINFRDQDAYDVSIRFVGDGSSWQLGPITGQLGPGTLKAQLTVEEHADGFFVELEMSGRQFQTRGVDAPLIDGELRLSGSGSNLRELLAGANGSLYSQSSEGLIYEWEDGFLFSDLAMRTLSRVVAQDEPAQKANQQCSVIALELKEGVAEVRVAALQTDTVGIVSQGRIDLATEKVDLGFRTQQRKGTGLSLGAVVNPYVRMSGTMANPTFRLDKKSGAVAGGAAFFTGGLSILGRVMWDRYLRSGDVCGAAIKRAGLEARFAETEGG